MVRECWFYGLVIDSYLTLNYRLFIVPTICIIKTTGSSTIPVSRDLVTWENESKRQLFITEVSVLSNRLLAFFTSYSLITFHILSTRFYSNFHSILIIQSVLFIAYYGLDYFCGQFYFFYIHMDIIYFLHPLGY